MKKPYEHQLITRVCQNSEDENYRLEFWYDSQHYASESMTGQFRLAVSLPIEDMRDLTVLGNVFDSAKAKFQEKIVERLVVDDQRRVKRSRLEEIEMQLSARVDPDFTTADVGWLINEVKRLREIIEKEKTE